MAGWVKKPPDVRRNELLDSAQDWLVCAAIIKPGREPAIHMVALLLIGVGAFLDSHATNLTRPHEM